MSNNETSAPAQNEQIDPATLPLEVRVAALEQALQFTMSQVKVTVTQESPILGGGRHSSTMSLLDFYLQQLRQAQMVIGNGNGR